MTVHAPAADDALSTLLAAVAAYFQLMHDCDLARFGNVFAETAQLHGFREGHMICWNAEAYREVLRTRRSPQSLGSPRQDEILLVDLAAPTQALVKVRLRISAMRFVDYLTWHRFDGAWRVTSKGFHLESVDEAGSSSARSIGASMTRRWSPARSVVCSPP